MAEGRGQAPRRGGNTGSGGSSGSAGPSRGGSSGGARGGSASGARGGQQSSGRRDTADRGRSSDRRPSGPPARGRGADRGDERIPRTEDQAKYDGPPIDPEITGRELDRNVAQQLRGLPEKLATRIARHLVAAGQLIDDDPKTAYEHTLAARARAARIAVVREACGEAAYRAGEYAEALSELRAAKRMNGNTYYLPVMADCERALGRPDRALALSRNPSVARLEDSLKAEMTIVEAGARRDMGELDAALRVLENAPLRSRSREDWVVRLRYAYADTLAAAGSTEQAIEWFHRTIGIDGNDITDAAERAEELGNTTS